MISYILIAFGIGMIVGGVLEISKKPNGWLERLITNDCDIEKAKEIANSLSHKINLFLQTTYQASIRLKLIFLNFPTYIKLGDKYIQIIDKDVSVDDEEDIVIDGDKALEIYLQNQSKDKE